MKKLILSLGVFTALSTFAELPIIARIPHSDCRVSSITESSRELSREHLIDTLRQKDYLVHDDVAINEQGQSDTDLSITLSVTSLGHQKPQFDPHGGIETLILKGIDSVKDLFYTSGYRTYFRVNTKDESFSYSQTNNSEDDIGNKTHIKQVMTDLLEKIPYCYVI